MWLHAWGCCIWHVLLLHAWEAAFAKTWWVMATDANFGVFVKLQPEGTQNFGGRK